MAESSFHDDWQYQVRARLDERGKAVIYSVAFYRERNGWYDEVRIDSHERKRGRSVEAPHFHAKLKTAFRDDMDTAVEEIKGIIDNYVKELAEAIG